MEKKLLNKKKIHEKKSKGTYGRLVDKVLKRYQNNILVKLLSVNKGVKKRWKGEPLQV